MSAVPGFTDAQLQDLLAFGAQKFASSDTEGQWMACHHGATGAITDRVTERRATAVRRSIKQANDIPTWRPFVMTRQGGELLLYSVGFQDRRSGKYRASRSAFVHAVARTPLYRYLDPPPFSYSRDRLSLLAG